MPFPPFFEWRGHKKHDERTDEIHKSHMPSNFFDAGSIQIQAKYKIRQPSTETGEKQASCNNEGTD